MKNLYALLVALSFFSIYTYSQDNEDCLPPDKKTLKLINRAKDLAPQEASPLFLEAMDKSPENAYVVYEYAMYAYNQAEQAYQWDPNPRKGDSYMRTAQKLFQKTLDLCPDYHSDCYYYMGVIHYSFDEKKEAIEMFKNFKAFSSSDANKYAQDYDKRMKDVSEVLKEVEEEMSFYENKVPFHPKKVENVSSHLDEYFPMLSPDNELMFYTRKVDRTAKGDIISSIREEFTWSQRKNKYSLFNVGTPLDAPFNDGTFDSYGASTLSVDNKEMIICACKDELVYGQKYRNCDLYVTYFERTGEGGNDYVWTPLKNLGNQINTADGWEGQPSLSADGNTLYFAANRPNTQNDDIFYSERLQDGSWGPAKPFTAVNTPGKDKSPFIHQDSETFYFISSVSDQRKGLGGTDIFYMRKDDNGNWEKPKNIGYPINTEEDEIGLFVSIDGKEAYFSSRQSGNWDIYSFDLYEEARPQAVVMVKGQLEFDVDTPVEDIEIEVSYSNSDIVETARVNGNDGKYAVVVKADGDADAMINVKKEGYAFDSKIIAKEELAKQEEIVAIDMNMKEIKVGEPYTINDILYATASAELSVQDRFVLKQFGRFLKENLTIRIRIEGHTDDVGNAQSNLDLSKRRANGVKEYLVSLGIDKSRLSAEGYGQERPKVSNTSATNRAINRRTDFVIEGL